MRIIAGSLKGRVIKTLAGLDTRPSSARLKESLFSILGEERLKNALVLDLFAGSGALGIEALSRGARRVYFIDKSREAIAVIKKNIQDLGLKDKCFLMQRDLKGRFPSFSEESFFDLIFIDPPYEMERGEEILKKLFESSCLHENSLIIYEHRAKKELKEENFKLVDFRQYGQNGLSFFKAIL